MSIRKRTRKDGSFVWECRINHRDPITGMRKPINVGSFATKREAEAAEAKVRVQLGEGTLLEPDRSTLSDVLDVWLPVVAQGLRPNTAVDYRGTVNRHIRPALGHVPIRKLSAAVIQKQYTKWHEAGVSPSVLSKIHQRLNQALTYAVKMRLVSVNVAADAKPPRIERPQVDHWSVDEAKAFLAAAKDDPLWPLWPLLLAEGLRRGEALALRWRDVDLEEGVAHIRQSVVLDKANRGAAKIASTKTRGSVRSVRLAPTTVAALKAYKPRWAEKALESEAWAGLDLIVCTKHGRPINPGNVRRNQTRICREAGVRPIRTHDLRHTSATLLLAAGEPLKTIADRLGHSSIRVTADMYAHSTAEMQSQAAETMGRLLGS